MTGCKTWRYDTDHEHVCTGEHTRIIYGLTEHTCACGAWMAEGLPDYLCDDAPCQRCDRCGRKTWSTEDFGAVCLMTQPDSTRCRGIFANEGSHE